MKNIYRPEIAAGVSRGRFAAILSRFTMTLNEMHAWGIDYQIDSSFGVNLLGISSYLYRPGIPLVNTTEFFARSNFGAGLTPLPDSTALVYNVMPNHPLGLQPGDIILGYDGIPWMKLFNELRDAELPFLGGGRLLSSTPAAALHTAITVSGLNWGLFDTIDVRKYGTDQLLHFPTSLLNTIKPPYPFATEQLPIPGVPYPDLKNNKSVSWGVITGTTIGYIYALDWANTNTKNLFTTAVNELMHTQKVDGLILDFRTNQGGMMKYADGGFNHLFNFEPTSNILAAFRVAGSDRFSYTLTTYRTDMMPPLIPTPEIFDHPIAMLTGPQCRSAGDHNADRMRFHPMVRSFGLPTNGGYAYAKDVDYLTIGPYDLSCNDGSAYTAYNNQGVLIHNPFPVDEKVWLTRDGVAKGEDDVVKKALEWINATAHAYSPVSNKSNYIQNDSIILTVKVRNPLNHNIALTGTLLTSSNIFVDSNQFFNDGLHGDGVANDSVWGCFLKTPSQNVSLYYRVRFTDKSVGTFREISYKNILTTSVSNQNVNLPKVFSMSQNYPNPFNPSTMISYQLPITSKVSLKIYDMLGREIATLVNEEQTAGWKEVEWNGSAFSSGIYFYKLTAGNFVDVKRMLMIK